MEEFYIKELAFFHPFTMEYWSGIFKAPFILTNCKKKLRNNIERNTEQHGLNWEHGDHPYYMVDQMLHFFGYYHILHAAAEVTCRILQQHTSYTITKLENMNIPKWYMLPFGSYCYYHDSMKNTCALDKCVRLGHSLRELYSMKHLYIC